MGGSAPWPGRAILHVDMDAFYVSVELRRRPELRGKPVVVGGSGPRGVIAAASYEARRFGVRSALPSSTAQRLCPHLIFLSGDHDHYGEVSGQVQAIFNDVTPLVEPLSLDEAFLDITGAQRLLGAPAAIAAAIRTRIAAELDLPCSVGVASNKFLAKLASVGAKPKIVGGRVRPGHGVLVVAPGEELAFLHPLPVTSLWGVGPATLTRLERLGVTTVGDVASLDPSALVASIGKAAGRHLAELSWGRDERAVEPDRPMKSISHEETYATDKYTPDELQRELVRLADGVARRLRGHGTTARTMTLKVRFAGFETITRSTTVRQGVDTAHEIIAALTPLLAAIDPTPGVRLLGVGVAQFEAGGSQLALDFDGDTDVDDHRGEPTRQMARGEAWRDAEHALDDVRRRFGETVIGPASAVEPGGRLRVVRRGAQQWGPDKRPGNDARGPMPQR
jgi:DNA polymerase-4